MLMMATSQKPDPNLLNITNLQAFLSFYC